MADRLHNIDREIQRCMSELDTQSLMSELDTQSLMGELDTQSLMSEIDTQSYMPGGNNRKQSLRDAELRALEAEVFGGRSAQQQTEYALGVWYENAEHGTKSYYVEEDGELVFSDLNNLVSCQSGGMYGMTSGKDVSFKQRKLTVKSTDGTEYTLFVHKTNNKDGNPETCAISVFKGLQFVAYLFSTNDPLAFDNFNCFRGDAQAEEQPKLKSVEQLVFCESKVCVNLKIINMFDKSQLFAEAMHSTRVTHGLLTQISKKIGMDLEPKVQEEKSRFLSEIQKSEPRLNDEDKESLKNRMTAEARRLMSEWPDKEVLFHDAYCRYFQEKLEQPPGLVPFSGYKQVGQSVFAMGNYVQEFESISLMCVVSARMRQLSRSKTERSLVAALVPNCVVECSKDDFLWAYVMEPYRGERLTWLSEDADGRVPSQYKIDRLHHIVSDASSFQNAYITHLAGLIENGLYEDAADFLFARNGDIVDRFKAPLSIETARALLAVGNDFRKLDPRPRLEFMDRNVHKLGLSERIIQSLWTRQIVFPERLIELISTRLSQYNIPYFHYVPRLVEYGANKSAFMIASAIGKRL